MECNVTAATVALAGAPFTPLTHYMDDVLMKMLPEQPHVAVALMAGHFAVSVVLVRFLLVNILSSSRFVRNHKTIENDDKEDK